MANMNEQGVWEHVPSPFCGIGSDDLKIRVSGSRVEVLEHGDAVTKAAFEHPLGETQPLVDGKPASLEQAVARAAGIVAEAELPLLAGLATDVAGMRAALSLADHIGAVVDNMNSTAAMRNILVLQDSGWMTTTLAEVKNRADLFVAVGVDVEALFPRFFERHIWVDGMFVEAADRRIVYIGKGPSGYAAVSPDGRKPRVLLCEEEDLPAVVSMLRLLVNDRPVGVDSVGGIPITELKSLAKQLKGANYGVVAWAAGAMDWNHAELTVQSICEMVKDLNHTTRCSGLPLGGREGDQTANQVCGWQTGYPVRTRFSRGIPEYDPYLNASERLLGSREVDALLWLSAYNCANTPPDTDLPTVVLGRSGMTFDQTPQVYIPVGVPGIDHAGHTYRLDNVVAVRLFKLRDSGLPSSAQVLQLIEQSVRYG